VSVAGTNGEGEAALESGGPAMRPPDVPGLPEEIVLDASVLVKWFKRAGEQHVEAARQVRVRYARGELAIAVPPLLFVEILNAAGRRWNWDAAALDRLARQLGDLAFQVQQPSLAGIARWCGRGLTAYDACYVALAEERGVVVLTADTLMQTIGGSRVTALAQA
jgi:predicted nucleic acid-binding protein